MARATATASPTDQDHWTGGKTLAESWLLYLVVEVLQNLEYLQQTHAHRDTVANDGGALVPQSALGIRALIGGI